MSEYGLFGRPIYQVLYTHCFCRTVHNIVTLRLINVTPVDHFLGSPGGPWLQPMFGRPLSLGAKQISAEIHWAMCYCFGRTVHNIVTLQPINVTPVDHFLGSPSGP